MSCAASSSTVSPQVASTTNTTQQASSDQPDLATVSRERSGPPCSHCHHPVNPSTMYTTCKPEFAKSRADRNSTRKNALLAIPTGKLLIRASTVSQTLAVPVTNPSSSATVTRALLHVNSA